MENTKPQVIEAPAKDATARRKCPSSNGLRQMG